MLVLASQSPRRSEILRQAGIPFVVRAAPVDETPLGASGQRIACSGWPRLKALAVPAGDDEIVLAADTTVAIGGVMLGKPADAADASRMLAALAGRTHEVLTGVALRRGEALVRDWASTRVRFAPHERARDRLLRG